MIRTQNVSTGGAFVDMKIILFQWAVARDQWRRNGNGHPDKYNRQAHQCRRDHRRMSDYIHITGQ